MSVVVLPRRVAFDRSGTFLGGGGDWGFGRGRQAGTTICHILRYTFCMAQLIARVDDELMAELDSIVASGEAESRSDAVRRALEAMIDQRRRRLIGEAIAEGYRRVPETDEELGWAIDSTRSMIAEEPW